MTLIEEFVDVDVPASTAYDQWMQFEAFPRFMRGVDEVRRLSATTLEWLVTIGGFQRQWRARIVEQIPDRRISWVWTEGARNDGSVSFSALGPDRTRIRLVLEVDPAGPLERIGTAAGLVRRRVRGDLGRFRDRIEAMFVETGTWHDATPAGNQGLDVSRYAFGVRPRTAASMQSHLAGWQDDHRGGFR